MVHAHGVGLDRHFNPRSREGSDSVRFPRAGRRDYFNPRSREGSDATVTA